ncbi:tetratricopeptide repeat protein [Kamptonema sp. UHCC 0994]|uniref:tetratricopeptide repeat protein n=1 Tax=Kamptonema sp. UHCC 0994 TaxID=3031329 RepID=UPI0023BA1396|nr:tetratricopeptide repeat protein [Kamptonema sp. UHCC 0994]MDF0554321.1 tetratricopeptide repeat protein [Kamptonema sp. UHCC 0994]
MDYQLFTQQLSNLYDNWGTPQVYPKSSQFQPIINQVETTTTVNVMQLLNLAVEFMPRDEIYCEIGTFQGGSLIAAMLNHSEHTAYTVDNFLEFDPFADNFDNLAENLSNFNLTEQVLFCHQDFEEFFSNLREMQSADKIGVYFYDASQDYRSQFLALLLAKPFLADEAIIILNNSNSAAARQANWDFIAANPESQLLLDFSTPELTNSWNSLQVLSWNVHQTENYDWSTFHQVRNSTVIQSIYKLQSDSKREIAENLYNQALTLYQTGKLTEAEQKFKQALRWNQNQVEAWHHLAILYYMTERYQDARNILLKSLEIDSSQAIQYYTLGLVFEKLGDFTQAVLAYQEAIALNPNYIDAYNNLGNILFQVGRLSQAESIYRQAIAVNPEHYGSYLNLANILLAQQQIDEAVIAYEKSLQLKPNDAKIVAALEFVRNLKSDENQTALYFGNDCYQRGEYQGAITYYHKFLANQAGNLELYFALAECHQKLEQYPEAIQVYRNAIDIYPKVANLYRNLISALIESGETKKAITIANHAASLFPDDWYFHPGELLILPVIYENLEEIATYRNRFNQGIQQLIQQTNLNTELGTQKALALISQRTNFFLAYQGENDLDIQQKYGEYAHRVMAANYPQLVKPLPVPPLSKTGKIRIGYISGCLWGHTVGKLSLGWLRHHNSSEFEIYCYQINETQDQLTQQFRKYSHTFHYIPGNLELICQQILIDQLHLLVFIDLGLQALMTQLAALRLAPIQCTTWAHPVTSGLPTVDYFLSSDLMEPENATEHYSEKLIRLPNIGISYIKPTIPILEQTRSDFNLRDEAVVYLCCQTLCKYLPQHDRIFAEIAQQVPQAQFVFISRPNAEIGKQFQCRLQQAFTQYGLNSKDFCVILPRLAQRAYWNLYILSDIFLDTFSWSGGHTTLDAIACNLPIVTCPGKLMRGRHSYAILKMLGMTETIAKNEVEYVKIAVRLGIEAQWRNSIAERLMQSHPYLYDDKNCVAALEAFYQRAVQEAQLATSDISSG